MDETEKMQDLPLAVRVALKHTKEICGVSGLIARKDLPDGRYTALTPQIFATILTISQAGDELGYSEAYTYEDPEKAAAAFEAWEGNGEPDGWVRHIPSNRRRPNGDASKEHIRW